MRQRWGRGACDRRPKVSKGGNRGPAQGRFFMFAKRSAANVPRFFPPLPLARAMLSRSSDERRRRHFYGKHFLLEFLYNKQKLCYDDLSLDEKRFQRARRKAAASPLARANRRDKNSKAGVREKLAGMKGWRPSAWSLGSKPVRALIQADVILCRTSDRSACLYPRVLGPRAHDPGSVDVGIPLLARTRLRGRQVGRKWRSRVSQDAIRDLKKAPALHLLEKTGGTGNEDRRIEQPEASAQRRIATIF